MTQTTKGLLEKITLGEDSGLELKAVRISADRVTAPRRDSLADELAAFANARGGLCVLGVEDDTRDIVGIPRDKLDIAEGFVRELCHDSIDPPLFVVIQKLLLPSELGDEVPVLTIEVPRSLFVHKSPSGYFHRIGSSKREMQPEFLARLFQQRSQTRLIRFDEQAVPGTVLDDLDEALWSRFRTRRSSTEAREPLLEKLGLARRDDEGELRPSVAGILLATPDPKKHLTNAFIQAVAYRGDSVSPGPGPGPYQLDAADLSGPIDAQVLAALRFVDKNSKTRAFKGAGRVDVPQFDLGAVFEALVNAIAHRDHAIYGSKIRLRMFSDRLELLSPGALTNTMTVEGLSLRQSARNEVLTSLLARCPIPSRADGLQTERTAFMDKRGEGVNIILDRSEALSGRRPSYQVIDDAEVQLTIWAANP
ncbi:MAG: ATP-binding protein [Nannocystaceae bacterium]